VRTWRTCTTASCSTWGSRLVTSSSSPRRPHASACHCPATCPTLANQKGGALCWTASGLIRASARADPSDHRGVRAQAPRRRLYRCGHRPGVPRAGRGGCVPGGKIWRLARHRADLANRMRLLADMHIAPRTVRFLRSLGHDVVRVDELLSPTATDEAIMAAAVRDAVSSRRISTFRRPWPCREELHRR